MPALLTSVPLTECQQILRAQVQPKRLWHRLWLFAARTSHVFGTIDGTEFVLEASCDRFSKRMRGRLRQLERGTQIEYEWQVPLGSRVWGSHELDEEEIFHFLESWLEAKRIAEPGAAPAGNSGVTESPPSAT